VISANSFGGAIPEQAITAYNQTQLGRFHGRRRAGGPAGRCNSSPRTRIPTRPRSISTLGKLWSFPSWLTVGRPQRRYRNCVPVWYH
jgi:hypothetical protein